MNKLNKLNKKAQLTIFIILAIVIVAVLLVLFYPNIKVLVSGPVPLDYIDKCVEDAAQEALEKIVLQGGSIEPENYIMYQGNMIEYVCYTNEYYKRCVMQKPFLKQDIEAEINNYVKPKAEACLLDLKNQLEKRGGSVTLGKTEIKTSIAPTSILVSVEAPLTLTETGKGTSSFKKFNVNLKSHLYDLIMIASSISNWEARYGDSEVMSFMVFYPNLKIEKKKQGDGTTIYILTDKITQEKFQFASRSLVFPPGYFGA